MSEILQLRRGVGHLDDIKELQLHTYTPYTTAFGNNDEIRITIQSRDLCILPAESYLLIEFKPTKKDNKPLVDGGATFSQLSALNFFSELRYELNGMEIDRSKVPQITTALKTMIACKTSDTSSLASLKWLSEQPVLDQTYRVTIPLKFLFGFCEDYNKVVVNSKHDLILMRANTDTNVYIASDDSIRFNILRVHWKMPHVTLSDRTKPQIQRTIDRKEMIPLPFRSWDLYEQPNVPETNRNIWSVKTTTHTTRPRYVVVAFQTNRNHVVNRNPIHFDHCNLTNVRLYLNNERYPYDDMNLNFDSYNGNFNEMYNVLNRIQYEYYNGTEPTNPVDISTLLYDKSLMLFAFDCAHSDESPIKNGMVDVRIEMDARSNFPPLTTAYCLIIHDNLLHYCPATGIVHRDDSHTSNT